MVMPAISPALRSESEEPLEEMSVSVSVLGSVSAPFSVSAGGVSATAGVTVTGASVSAAAAVSAHNGFFMLLQ